MTIAVTEPIWLIGLAAASIMVGLGLLYAVFRTPPWITLPKQRWRAVPWGAGLCLSVMLLFIIPPSLIAGFLIPEGVSASGTDEEIKLNKIPYQLVASLIVFPFQLVLLRMILRRVVGIQATLTLGHWQSVARDIGLGWACCVIMTPIVLGLQWIIGLLTIWYFNEIPERNLLIQALQKRDADHVLWMLVTIHAILLAPISEEIIFRGLVQPWLIRRKWGGDIGIALAMVAPAILFVNMPLSRIAACVFFVVIMALLSWLGEKPVLGIASQSPWLFPRITAREGDQSPRSLSVYRGIIGTSLLFAVVHGRSWPDPVPLFVFSLVVGWLAWRTQSVVASIVCHGLFNATSIWILRMTTLLESSPVK